MSDSEAPANRMSERVPGSRLTMWLLMEASRRVVAAALLLALFVTFLVLGALDPVGLRTAMQSGTPLQSTFQGFVPAIITGVTLVVTINQLVLSQELGAAGDQYERMQGALDFRADVEEVIDRGVAPAEPSEFLRAIVETSRVRAEALAEAAGRSGEVGDRERIESFVDELAENARVVGDRLDRAEFGTFGALSAALDFNYSWKIHEARQIRDDLDDDETAVALDRLIEALEFFGPAREHVKTLYFQWELINLSRAVLYAAVPALVVAAGMILYVDAATIQGATLGIDHLVWVTSAAASVALVPFVVLLVYILRIATVAKRTLAIGPFVLRETDRTE